MIHFHSWVFLVYVYGHLLWIFLWKTLQDSPGPELEERGNLDRSSLPKHHFWHLFPSQLFHLGAEVFWSCSFHNDARYSLHVVRRFASSRHDWLLLRLQKAAVRGARSHEPDPSTGARPTLVHELVRLSSHVWSTAFRCSIY